VRAAAIARELAGDRRDVATGIGEGLNRVAPVALPLLTLIR
jgi:hypothetical protein